MTARSVAWPLPVKARLPCSDRLEPGGRRRSRARGRRPSRSASRKRAAASIGPMVCELEGPTPILKMSKTLRNMAAPGHGVESHACDVAEPLTVTSFPRGVNRAERNDRRLSRRRSGGRRRARRTSASTSASTAASPSAPVGGERVDHLQDQLADAGELGLAEAAGGAGGGAEADARGDERLLRVEGDRVLVAGEAGALQRPLGVAALHALRAQVDEHHVAVGAAGDDVEAAGLERRGERAGVGDDPGGVVAERRLQRLAEGDGLGGDDVHQRAALVAGEDGGVELLRQRLVVRQDDAAARAAQGLVGGRGGDVGVRHRVRVEAGGDQAGVVRHVDHQVWRRPRRRWRGSRRSRSRADRPRRRR